MAWVCKECGTNNEDELTECKVCGSSERYVPDEDEVVIDPAPDVEIDTHLTKRDVGRLAIVDGTVIVPEGYIDIGARAFEDNSEIEKVVLPSSLKKIYKEAFLNCLNLKEVVTSGPLDFIGERAFFNCPELSVHPTAINVRADAFGLPAPAPAPTYSGSSYSGGGDSGCLPIIGIVLAVAAVITGIVLLCVYAHRITWTQWQWMIGSIGGLLTVAALWGLSALWLLADDDEAFVITFILLLSALVIVNGVLSFVYKYNYHIISFWFDAYLLIALVCAAYYAFEEALEDGWGIVAIGTIIVHVIMMVIFIALLCTVFKKNAMENVGAVSAYFVDFAKKTITGLKIYFERLR